MSISFLANYLASREDLAPFLTLDHLSNVELSISNLSKLHTVHELVCLNQMYLSSKQVKIFKQQHAVLRETSTHTPLPTPTPLKTAPDICTVYSKKQAKKVGRKKDRKKWSKKGCKKCGKNCGKKGWKTVYSWTGLAAVLKPVLLNN